MPDTIVFPIFFRKAELTVAVDRAPDAQGVPAYCVSYTRKNKPQRDFFATLDEAKASAVLMLGTLVDEYFPFTLSSGGVTVKVYYTPTVSEYDAFTVSYYQEGKRKREQFGSLDAAKTRAKAIHGDLVKGEIGGASMTTQDRKAYLRSLQLLQPTRVSLESACKEFAAAFAMLNGVSIVEAARYYVKQHHEVTTPKLVHEVVDEFLAAKAEGRATRIKGRGKQVSERYLYDLRKRLERILRRFKGVMIGSLTSEQINHFLYEMKSAKNLKRKGSQPGRPTKPVSGRTRNNYLQSFKVLIEFARKQKYLPKDFSALDEVDLAEESPFDIEIYKPDEFVKILAAAQKDIVPVLAIGAFAGVRTAEICRLDWSEINLQTGFIEIKQGKAKTRSRRLVPISPNLALFLKETARPAGPIWSYSDALLFKAMVRAGQDSGVNWKHNALRHSFISYRVAKIKNVNEVSMEAGNSPDMIFKHYRELVTEKEADAWFGITPLTVTAVREKAEKEKAAKVVPLPKTEAA